MRDFPSRACGTLQSLHNLPNHALCAGLTEALRLPTIAPCQSSEQYSLQTLFNFWIQHRTKRLLFVSQKVRRRRLVLKRQTTKLFSAGTSSHLNYTSRTMKKSSRSDGLPRMIPLLSLGTKASLQPSFVIDPRKSLFFVCLHGLTFPSCFFPSLHLALAQSCAPL